MAYGSELFLGIVGKQPTMDTLQALALRYTPDEGLSEEPKLNAKLAQAQHDALTEMGLEVINPARIKLSSGRAPDTGYLYVKGLDGKVRQTCHWALEVDYDPGEMGHEEDDMLIGVSLISRYFPVFLDWAKESGGSGDTMALTPDILKNIEIARRHLSKVLPFIASAPVVFRERHY